jgi:S1-C subfamily serine protease
MRIIDCVVQTDAALHSGSSGGALANCSAEVVGVKTAVVGPGIGQGPGLAVPVNAATRQIIGSLMSTGRVRRAYLGIGGMSRILSGGAALSIGQTNAVVVGSIVSGSPADLAGLKPGDRIISLDGVATTDQAGLQGLMIETRIARSVPAEILRDDQRLRLDVVLGELRNES